MPSPLRCPLCGASLAAAERSLRCAAGHVFDRARSGYVNLLPAEHRHARAPGDSAAMVRARRLFLDGGHYEPVALAIADVVRAHAPSGPALDLGCGEGYFTRRCLNGGRACFGIDISKAAVSLASRTQRDIGFVVASNRRLPLIDAAFALALAVCAPLSLAETARVLAANGVLVRAVPGDCHLDALRALAFAHPRTSRQPAQDGWEAVASSRVCYQRRLDNAALRALVAMTPIAFRATRERLAVVHALDAIVLTVDFRIDVLRPLQPTPVGPPAVPGGTAGLGSGER